MRALRRRGPHVAAVAALASLLWGGAGAVGGCVAGAAFVAGEEAKRRRRASLAADEAIPPLLDALSAAMRAGASLAAALREVEPPSELAVPVAAMHARLDVGSSVQEAVDELAARLGTRHAALVAAALSIGHSTGGDVPRVLDVIAASARARTRIAREARVAATQARLSAWIVAALPLAFLAVSGAASKAQTRALLHTSAGWAMLACGGALEIAGLVWMRRLS